MKYARMPVGGDDSDSGADSDSDSGSASVDESEEERDKRLKDLQSQVRHNSDVIGH